MKKLKTLHNYDPRQLGAACTSCPLFKKRNWAPVPPTAPKVRTRLVVVGDSPGPVDRFKGINLLSNAGQRLRKDFLDHGTSIEAEAAIVNRIACYCPGNKKTDTILRKAAECCKPRFLAEIKPYEDKPTLYMGKWAPKGKLTDKEARLARHCMQNDYMVVENPGTIYFHKSPLIPMFQASLTRFLGKPARAWPKTIIHPSEEALEALRGLKDWVGFDVETLGVNPMEDPVSCFGLADEDVAVSVPWAAYETNKWGHIMGLHEYGSLGRAIREEIEKIMASDRHFVAHNHTYDILSLRSQGIEVGGTVVDSMHMHAILYPELRHGLEEVGCQVLDLPARWKTLFRNNDDDVKGSDAYIESSQEDLRIYNARDSWVGLRIAQELWKKL